MTKQPSSMHCFVCGRANQFGLHMDFYQNESGEVTANITVPDQFQGYPGIVHGGIIAAMLDEVTGRSIMISNPNRFMVTAKLSIRYRKPVPIGRPLRLTGRLAADNGRVASVSGKICAEDGTLLAEAEAVLVDIPESITTETDMEALGWRVYPDEEEAK
jgi:uncharacterized protein (TIGR00369 family)